MKAVTLSDTDLAKVREVVSIISRNLKYHYTIAELAEMVALNERKLKQGFKQLYNVGMFAYLLHLRMEKAKQMLQEDIPIRAIAIAIGYKGSNAETNFIRCFKKLYHQSPAFWKREQREAKWLSAEKHSA